MKPCKHNTNDMQKRMSAFDSVPSEIGEEFLTAIRGDGLIISTPTGSTGYSLFAGGPIVNQCVHAITVYPVPRDNLLSSVEAENEVGWKLVRPHLACFQPLEPLVVKFDIQIFFLRHGDRSGRLAFHLFHVFAQRITHVAVATTLSVAVQ